jgi:hypothetical protein
MLSLPTAGLRAWRPYPLTAVNEQALRHFNVFLHFVFLLLSLRLLLFLFALFFYFVVYIVHKERTVMVEEIDLDCSVFILREPSLIRKLTCTYMYVYDRLCGLVVRVSGYRSRGPRFDSRSYQIFWEVRVGLEPGPLSLVRTVEELLEWKSSGSGLECRH